MASEGFALLPWASVLAIDLGACLTHIAVPEAGVVVREPTMVAFAPRTRRVVAVGQEARRLWERGVTDVEIVRPVRGGYVADFDATVALLRPLILRALGRRPWFPPQTVISCPADITPVLLRALQDSVHVAGGGHPLPVSKPLAAGLGAGLTANQEEATLVVDLGGGATDVGVFAGGLITATRTIPFGGELLTEALIRAVRRESGLRINEVTAQQVKEQVSSLNGYSSSNALSVAASEEGAPGAQPHDLEGARVPEILARAMEPLLNELLWTVEQLPHPIQHELTNGGVVLTGGGALLRGIEEMVRNTLHLPTAAATDPVSCTILGLEAVLRDLPSLTLNGKAFGAQVG